MAYNGYAKLPSSIFHVRVPVISTYSDEEMQFLGIPMGTSQGKVKHDSYFEMTNVYLNLDRMIDVYMDGYPIQVVNSDDVPKIYNILDDYINGVNRDRTSLNARQGKDDRIIFIDKFIEEILGYNKASIVKDNLNVSTGFDVGVMKLTPAGLPTTNKYNVSSRSIGIMGGYKEETIPPNVNTAYINPTEPVIDLNKVKRNSPISYKKGVEFKPSQLPHP